MSETGHKAVFLSYASQDAEAARRICEALRAAGVEVWFDQSELVGGDSWDQKIRRQIKECALFVPIVSAITNARGEGYFRLEWKLAVDRSHLMARDQPFLVPVGFDDTANAHARVPEEFHAVQWSKLPGGENAAGFAQQVRRLLDGSAGVSPAKSSHAGGTPALPGKRPRRHWLAVGLLGVAAASVLAVWRPWRGQPETITGGGGVKTIAPLSEARSLVTKVWEQLNKPELARAELEVADDLCKRAAALDTSDAEVWAAWSHVDTWYSYHNLDRSLQRREGARTKAARAIQLAPTAYEPRLAQVNYLVRAAGNEGMGLHNTMNPMFAAEAERLLRALLHEKSGEPRAALTLALLLRRTGKWDEAREIIGRVTQNPAFAVAAWTRLGWTEIALNEYRAAEAAVSASIALQPFWDNLSLKALMAARWLGDLDLAKVTLDRIPSVVQQEDPAVAQAAELYYWRREPQNMLRVLSGVPRDWLQSNGYDGPKVYLAGLAYQMAGNSEAAQVQWRAAARLVERRLNEQPNSGFLLRWRGRLLSVTGNRTEAEATLRLAGEMGEGSPSFWTAVDQIALGNLDAAIGILETLDERRGYLTAASCRLYPAWDALRDHPRFKALLARLEADPRTSPNAPAKASVQIATPRVPENPSPSSPSTTSATTRPTNFSPTASARN